MSFPRQGQSRGSSYHPLKLTWHLKQWCPKSQIIFQPTELDFFWWVQRIPAWELTYPNRKFGNSSIQKCQLERVYVWSLEGTVKTEITRWKASLSVHVGELKINQSSPRWWQLKHFLFSTLKIGEDSHFDSYFSNGVGSTTNQSSHFPSISSTNPQCLTWQLPSCSSGIRRFKVSSNLALASGCETVRLPKSAISHHLFTTKWWWKMYGTSDIPGDFRQSEGWWHMIILARSYVFFWPKKTSPTPATNLGFVYCLGWFFFSSHCIPWDSSPFSMQQQETRSKVQGPGGVRVIFWTHVCIAWICLFDARGGGKCFKKISQFLQGWPFWNWNVSGRHRQQHHPQHPHQHRCRDWRWLLGPSRRRKQATWNVDFMAGQPMFPPFTKSFRYLKWRVSWTL